MWNNEGQEYFYDKHEWVRIRIEQEHWNDLSPLTPAEIEVSSALERKSPYSLTVSQRLSLAVDDVLLTIGFNDAIGSWAYRVVVIIVPSPILLPLRSDKRAKNLPWLIGMLFSGLRASYDLVHLTTLIDL